VPLSLATILVACVAWLVLRRPGWNTDARPQLLSHIAAEVLFDDLGDIVRVGPRRLIVVRFLEPVDLVPLTFEQCGLKAPAPIGDYAQRLDAPILFNAGQFDANLRYLGWLKGRGQWLSESRKAGWQGLLVTGPTADPASGPRPYGQILDLETLAAQDAQGQADAYANVVQSMMLLDDAAQVRVRRSERAACRTVVAQDVQGRLLVMASEGAVTLYDLAQWLGQSNLQISRAMNLDGGVESQLAVVTPELNLMLYGQYGTESQLFGPRAGGANAPLPMVVAAFPRSAGGS
jgi:hypothetical protein